MVELGFCETRIPSFEASDFEKLQEDTMFQIQCYN